ncbi:MULTISPECIES: gliding motility lipoprotein GldH [unclassified Aureispira]|uniref:gliding motility lipoprotein GldH n=1 Tax=unclassified Aureispira TaxID=2649989 RepID=UPI0006973EB6|nr:MULTISPECIES: gliding motility lipoprotein GldH [unclassified Aureispira]WMX15126.1 gliding motility lipoprotein GldH [Aureispira sp. CCB-E]
MLKTILTTPQKKINFNSCSRLFLQWATVFVLCLNLASCSTVYDQTTIIENGVWTADNFIEFEFEIQDTSQLYDIFIEVNHDANYAYQNIYCLVETFELKKQIREDLCSLELADSKGNWKSDDCGTEVCNRKIPFIIKTQFNRLGIHKIVFKQNTREANLEGINSLRLLIETTN